MSVLISEYNPPVELQPFVELFWEGDFNTNFESLLKQQVVPNGFVELIIHLTDPHCELSISDSWSPSPDYTIIGLYTRPYEVHFRDRVNVFGIRFKPEGIYNTFGIPASMFSESYEDMENVLGRDFKEYSEKLRDAAGLVQRLKLTNRYFLKQLEKHNPGLTYVNRAAEIIRDTSTLEKIDELPGKVFVSLRQLEREFKQKVGTTPKRYMRIARLNRVHRQLEAGENPELTRVAFECGYTDQSHFIRDFKNLMGVNPTSFFNNRDRFIVNN